MTHHDGKDPSPLLLGLTGGLLLWAALPPLELGWLAWIAPLPWLLLVRAEQLPARRPYRTLWLAGFVFWLAAIHWLRLPHPAVYLGWLALSAYLACYLPAFVGLTRLAVHRLRTPLWLAAPIVWIGLELARAHLLTGFLMGSISHTQVHWTTLIQVSDLAGQYAVDFLILTVAAAVTCVTFRPRRPLALIPALVLMVAVLVYGRWRLSDLDSPADPSSPPPTVRLALIQGNSLADWKSDAAKQRTIMDEYIGLSHDALAQARERDGRPIDLVVWPETMFRSPLRTFDPGYQLPADITQTTQEIAAVGPNDLAHLAAQLNTPVLVGVDRVHFLEDDSPSSDAPSYRAYNSSVLVDRDGRIVGTYDKVHLVMFGEYVPFSGWLPFLKRVSSITGSVDAGSGPAALCLDEICYAPNICYETAIPHVIRRQVATLRAQGQRPDVLVNLTNDAWYWGSSELDMHLACDVYRAIETRTPLVVAANGGISAWIDHVGRVRAESPRMQPDVILADVELNRERGSSVYAKTGDWFAGACLACCVVLAVVGWRERRGSR